MGAKLVRGKREREAEKKVQKEQRWWPGCSSPPLPPCPLLRFIMHSREMGQNPARGKSVQGKTTTMRNATCSTWTQTTASVLTEKKIKVGEDFGCSGVLKAKGESEVAVRASCSAGFLPLREGDGSSGTCRDLEPSEDNCSLCPPLPWGLGQPCSNGCLHPVLISEVIGV